MISGLDLEATVDFKLSFDKKNPTIWKLGVLPSDLYARIVDTARTDPVNSAFLFLQVGLKGWENSDLEFKTEEINILGQKIQAVPMSVLGKIPIKAINELSDKLMENQSLTDDEIKN